MSEAPKACTSVPCPPFEEVELMVTKICECRNFEPGQLFTPGCPLHDPGPDPWDEVLERAMNIALEGFRASSSTQLEDLVRLGVKCGMIAAWHWSDENRDKYR